MSKLRAINLFQGINTSHCSKLRLARFGEDDESKKWTLITKTRIEVPSFNTEEELLSWFSGFQKAVGYSEILEPERISSFELDYAKFDRENPRKKHKDPYKTGRFSQLSPSHNSNRCGCGHPSIAGEDSCYTCKSD